MTKPLILVIDDEASHRRMYADVLSANGYRVETVDGADTAATAMAVAVPDMVVSDVKMPGIDGISFMRTIKAEHPELPFLLVTAYADVGDAVEALKMGAVDYLRKPVDLDELVAAVADTAPIKPAGDDEPEVPPHLLADMVVESSLLKAVFRDAHRIAKSDVTVLITGESGVGKEILARFIHRASNRRGKDFLAFNCASVAGGMIGSELFGHRKGAYTGAIDNRNGIFRQADGGTVLLDEIGDMPLDLQPTLLRAIETGMISPLGSDREVKVNTRVIAATNKNLPLEVENGNFRRDLFYRLNVIALDIPPLRERPDDCLPLTRHFLKSGGGGKRLSPAVAKIIRGYPWPGNVRELANAVERARLLSHGDVILPANLPPQIIDWAEGIQNRGYGDPSAPNGSVRTMIQMEEDAIRAALAETDGNRTKAAEMLGISRRNLIYKLKKYGIK